VETLTVASVPSIQVYQINVMIPEFAMGHFDIARYDDGLYWTAIDIWYGNRTGMENSLPVLWYVILDYASSPYKLLPIPLNVGDSWAGEGGWVFAGNGTLTPTSASSKALRFESSEVPAGTFECILIESVVTAADDYGSGRREMWFADGVGLVKLVYYHDEGSTTEAQLIDYAPKIITTETIPRYLFWVLPIIITFAAITVYGVRRKTSVVRLSRAHPDDLKVGTRALFDTLGNRILRVSEIREGGMARIYVCADRKNRKLVLKTFRQTISSDSQKIRKIEKRFYHEAALWIGLGTHPNIVRALSFARMRDRPYLLLEFVEGGNLRDRINSQQFDLMHSLKPARDICSGIGYAHSKGVVHRDIKPENVLIDHSGIAKVTDFGLARVVDEESRTMSQDLTGTLPYMSPEQLSLEEPVDERSDVYSFGVVLYEMLSGERPFEAESAGQLVAAHRELVPPPRVLAQSHSRPSLIGWS
jgi:tRNA A-37 threonylcarbamoyl transferase component Bud32